MEPILHLSLPVRDLGEAQAFYVDALGCTLGRVRDEWIDVWFHGLQLTLQHHPDEVRPVEEQGVRHFGVTLDRDALDDVLACLRQYSVTWVGDLPHIPIVFDDTPGAKTSVKVADPSGNVIELKSYADPDAALHD